MTEEERKEILQYCGIILPTGELCKQWLGMRPRRNIDNTPTIDGIPIDPNEFLRRNEEMVGHLARRVGIPLNEIEHPLMDDAVHPTPRNYQRTLREAAERFANREGREAEGYTTYGRITDPLYERIDETLAAAIRPDPTETIPQFTRAAFRQARDAAFIQGGENDVMGMAAPYDTTQAMGGLDD